MGQKTERTTDESNGHITCRYTIRSSDITLEHKIPILASLDNELEEWICDFRKKVQLCKWNGEPALNVLHTVIKHRISNEIENKRMLDTALDQLINFIFSPKAKNLWERAKANKTKKLL